MKSYIKYLLMVLILSFVGGIAYALNVDQTRNIPARVNTTQQTNYYRFTINYNDPNISTAQKFGAFLKNTFVTSLGCDVTVAFNAGTTNVVTVGISSGNANELIDAATSNHSIDETTAHFQAMTSYASLGLWNTSDADHTLYAKYTQTGTAATAGSVTCVLEYSPNNDM